MMMNSWYDEVGADKEDLDALIKEQRTWEEIFESIGWVIGEEYKIGSENRLSEEQVWNQIKDMERIITYNSLSDEFSYYILDVYNGNGLVAKDENMTLIRKANRICVLFSAPYISKRVIRKANVDLIDTALKAGWRDIKETYSLEILQGAIVYLNGCMLDENSDFHKILRRGVYKEKGHREFYKALIERAEKHGKTVNVLGEALCEISVDSEFMKKKYGNLSGNNIANELFYGGYIGAIPLFNYVMKECLYVPIEALNTPTAGL